MKLIPVCPQCGSKNTVTIEGDGGTTSGPDVRCMDCQWKGQPIISVSTKV